MFTTWSWALYCSVRLDRHDNNIISTFEPTFRQQKLFQGLPINLADWIMRYDRQTKLKQEQADNLWLESICW